MAATDTPAALAPASRSGKDHAAAEKWAHFICGDTEEWRGNFDQSEIQHDNLAHCYLAYAALLSRDSGEAVKWAQLLDETAEYMLQDWDDREPDSLSIEVRHKIGDRCKASAADVLSLSASEARLTEDNKRLREALEQARDHVRFLLPLAKGYVHAHPGIESTNRIIVDANEYLTPTASGAAPAEGEEK